MQLLGDLVISGFLRGGAFEELNEYPANPRVGSWAFIQKRFMLCVSMENDTPFWIPLTGELNSYVHTQDVVSDTWIVSHNLNFSTPIIQCYDGGGAVVNPSEITPIDQDTLQVKFPDPILGRAILMYGANEGLAKPNVAYTKDFTNLSEVVVPHGLGYKPQVVVVSEGAEVQPKSIVHDDSNMSLTLEFSSPISGTVRCI